MRLTMEAVGGLLAGLSFATFAAAEEYDFELDVGIGSTDFDGSKTITTNGGTIFNSGSTDTDNFSIVGSWYFNGLSDAAGPRARAELVSRASSLSLGYGRTEQTNAFLLTNSDPSLPIAPLDSSFDSAGDLFAADVRYVDRDSGWFGTAGLMTSNTNSLGFVDESVDAVEWRLGFGRYIAENTTVSFGAGRIDFDSSVDATVYAVSLEHLGDLAGGWQYGIDLSFDRTDSDFSDLDALNAAISLYPSRDLEFGIAVSDLNNDGGPGSLNKGYGAFASWFVTPNVSLSASYRVDDADFLGNVVIGGAPTESDADSDSFGISATWRFD